MPDLGVVSLMLQVVLVVAGAIWLVSRLNTTISVAIATIHGSIENLTTSVDHLREATDRLESAIRELDGKIDDHESRLIRVEAHTNTTGRIDIGSPRTIKSPHNEDDGA